MDQKKEVARILDTVLNNKDKKIMCNHLYECGLIIQKLKKQISDIIKQDIDFLNSCEGVSFMDDWKDLNIGNIPSDFFVNDNYEIEFKRVDSGCYRPSVNTLLEERYGIIRDMRRESPFVFRYRLKPLEPIRMTKELMFFVWDKIVSYGGFNIEVHNMCKEEDRRILSIDGRKVDYLD